MISSAVTTYGTQTNALRDNVQNATDSLPYLSLIIIFDPGVIAIASIQRGTW